MAKAKKKWAHLIGQYPYRVEPESTYNEAINARARSITTLPMGELTQKYKTADAAVKAAEDDLKLKKAEKEACVRALFDRLQRDGLDEVTVAGETFSPSVEPYPEVKEKSTFVDWAITEHRGNLTMHHQTLKALVKSAIDGEGEMPPGIDIYLARTFKPRKA